MRNGQCRGLLTGLVLRRDAMPARPTHVAQAASSTKAPVRARAGGETIAQDSAGVRIIMALV